MKTNRPDISHIRKYLHGELDARAMYELERQAQDDPLLMDLLMGMESATEKIHQDNLSSIEQQIRQRVRRDQRKKRPYWKVSAMAAAVLLLFAVVTFWIGQMSQEKKLIVSNEVTEEKIPTVDTTLLYEDSPLAMAEIQKSPGKVSRSMAERSTEGVGSKKEKASSRSNRIAQAPAVDTKDYKAREPNETSVAPDRRPDTMNSLLAAKVAGRAAIMRARPNEETNIATDRTDSLTIAMAPSNVSLNEIVTVGYKNEKKMTLTKTSNDTIESMISGRVAGVQIDKEHKNPVKKPEPEIGWDAYKAYLRKEAITNGDQVTVVLVFQVDDKGNPMHIRVEKGGDELLNEHARSIVENGPKWLRGTSTNEVSMKIKFSKP